MDTKITVAKTIDLEQAWMGKDHAIVYFGCENRKPYFQKLLATFKEHKDFKDGYLAPTYKVVLIHIATFEKFLRWHEANKFKRVKNK